MKPRKKRSIVWTPTKDQFQSIIDSAKCMADVCIYFGLRRDGGNYATIKRRIQEENISFDHFSNGQKSKQKWKLGIFKNWIYVFTYSERAFLHPLFDAESNLLSIVY